MKDIYEVNDDINLVISIQRTIDLVTAALLLSGQITIFRLIVAPGGFSISVGGPLTGSSRLEGLLGNKNLSFLLDVGDILLGILLIMDQINVEGIFLGPGRFSFNITGPIFGLPKNQPVLPDIEKIFTQFKWIVSDHFDLEPQILRMK